MYKIVLGIDWKMNLRAPKHGVKNEMKNDTPHYERKANLLIEGKFLVLTDLFLNDKIDFN